MVAFDGVVGVVDRPGRRVRRVLPDVAVVVGHVDDAAGPGRSRRRRPGRSSPGGAGSRSAARALRRSPRATTRTPLEERHVRSRFRAGCRRCPASCRRPSGSKSSRRFPWETSNLFGGVRGPAVKLCGVPSAWSRYTLPFAEADFERVDVLVGLVDGHLPRERHLECHRSSRSTSGRWVGSGPGFSSELSSGATKSAAGDPGGRRRGSAGL